MKKSKLLMAVLLVWFSFEGFSQEQFDSTSKTRLIKVSTLGTGIYIGGLSYLSLVWYKEAERVPFNFYNDNKGYFQMDKWGHAYTAYYQSLGAYKALKWAGLSEKKATLYGGPVGLLFQTPIEIFDGIYEGWGFSWGDMGANAFGSALFTSQQLIWNEQRIRMKFSYSPSPYPEYHHALGENELESFFLDYNAHTYWLSANISDFNSKQERFKWLNVAFGYSANGMIKEFENPQFYRGETFPELDRYRQYLLSLDVDFSKIKTNRKGLRFLFGALNCIKIPFPALEYNQMQGFKFNSIYF
jgi:hypothetical protein